MGSVIARRGPREPSSLVRSHLGVMWGPIALADEAAGRLAGGIGVTPTPTPTSHSPHAGAGAPVRLLAGGHKGGLLEGTPQVAKLREGIATKVAEGAELREGIGGRLVGTVHVGVMGGTVGCGEAAVLGCLLVLLVHGVLVLLHLPGVGPLASSKEGLHGSLKVGLVRRARGLSRGPWGHLPHACMAPRGHGEHDPREGPSRNEARLGGRYSEAVRLTNVWWWIGVHGRQSHAVPSLRWPLLGMPLPHGPLIDGGLGGLVKREVGRQGRNAVGQDLQHSLLCSTG